MRNLARARPLASSQRVCAAMGPQPCPGPCADGTLTELASETVRSKWAQSEGVKWEWRTSDVQHTKCAWWRWCVPCHRLAWPLDRRNRNGSSMPWESLCATRPGEGTFARRRTQGRVCLSAFLCARCLGPLAEEGSACCEGALADHSGSRTAK